VGILDLCKAFDTVPGTIIVIIYHVYTGGKGSEGKGGKEGEAGRRKGEARGRGIIAPVT